MPDGLGKSCRVALHGAAVVRLHRRSFLVGYLEMPGDTGGTGAVQLRCGRLTRKRGGDGNAWDSHV